MRYPARVVVDRKDVKVDGMLIRRKYDAKNDPRGIVLTPKQYSLWNSMNAGKDFTKNVDPTFGGRLNKPENRHGPHFGRGENARSPAQSDIVKSAKEWVGDAGWQTITNLVKQIIPNGGSDSDWEAVLPDSASPFKVNGVVQKVKTYYNPRVDPRWGKWEKKTYEGDPAVEVQGKYYKSEYGGKVPGGSPTPNWLDVPGRSQTIFHKHRFGITRSSYDV